MRSFATSILKLAAALAGLFLLYCAWYVWDMHQLRAFCEEIRPGTPVAELPRIAGRHGVDARWLQKDGAFSESMHMWVFYVPSTASVGSNVCVINHDKSHVIGATVEYD
jgi:hypothetical protein